MVGRTKIGGAIAGLAILFGGEARPAPPAIDASCFTKGDNAALSYHVFQTARIPDGTSRDAPPSASSPYFPGTDFLTTVDTVRNQDSRYAAYYFTWANRCLNLSGVTQSEAECRVTRRANGDPVTTDKGNSYVGQQQEANLRDQVRAAFSSYAAADSCTIAQEMQALGMSDTAISARAAAGRIRIYAAPDRSTSTMRRMTQPAGLADGRRWNYLVNICVLPPKGAARSFAGVGLDYEVNDNRSPPAATAFLLEYARLAHEAGKKAFLAMNPLPRPASGLDQSNVQTIIAGFDYFSIPLTNGATPGNELVGNKRRDATKSLVQSYREQIGTITSNGQKPLSPGLASRVIWQVPLYQISLPDAATVQAAIKRGGFGGVSIFRNYVRQGGSCSRPENQITACIALGQCTGRFGGDRP